MAEYELFRWDQYKVFRKITKKLARSGVDRKNVLAYSIPNNAFSTADSIYTTYASGGPLLQQPHAVEGRDGQECSRPPPPESATLGMQEAITDFALLPNDGWTVHRPLPVVADDSPIAEMDRQDGCWAATTAPTTPT